MVWVWFVATLKLLGSFLSHIMQGKICAEGLQGRHAFSMLGRILQHNDVAISHSVA